MTEEFNNKLGELFTSIRDKISRGEELGVEETETFVEWYNNQKSKVKPSEPFCIFCGNTGLELGHFNVANFVRPGVNAIDFKMRLAYCCGTCWENKFGD